MSNKFEFSDDEQNCAPIITVYDIFGVEPDASMDDIKKSRKQIAKKLHPDKHITNKDWYNNLMKKYNKIYDELERKHQSKQSNQNMDEESKSENLFENFNVKTVFRDLNDSNDDTKVQKVECNPGKTPPLFFDLFITLKESFTGFDRKIMMELIHPCAHCKSFASTITDTIGYGCYHCRGKGMTKGYKPVKVKLPKGIKENEEFVLKESGNQFPNKTKGDIIFKINFSKNDVSWKLDGNDVYLIGIPYLNGKTLKYKSKNFNCIKGKGMPIPGKRRKYGDLYVPPGFGFK